MGLNRAEIETVKNSLEHLLGEVVFNLKIIYMFKNKIISIFQLFSSFSLWCMHAGCC